jgi:integrase
MWVAAAYDDLRRAGPDRARQVRRIIDGYLLPWFAPQTNTVGDISYFMVHDWLLTLVGRRSSQPAKADRATAVLIGVGQNRELSMREAGVAASVSAATVRRRWRDGELVGAYRDSHGHIRIPEATAAAVRNRGGDRPAGLSQPVVADALWVLRRILAFARANGIVPAGFDPTEGLDAPRPDPAAARARRPACQPRPLSFPECARIGAHLHPVHQLVLWLQWVMGLRISEAFGLLVDDVVDLGETGLLLVRGQGGRLFRVRDDDGRVITVSHKESTKTEASSRVLVVPPAMMELLRVTLEAFHTDPDSGDAEETARLVPGLRNGDEADRIRARPHHTTDQVGPLEPVPTPRRPRGGHPCRGRVDDRP